MIIRSQTNGNIPAEILNNPNLSAKAKGIMAQLLSKPDDWKFNVQELVDTNKDGKVAIRSAIKELEGQNFVHWFSIRKDGKIAGTEYLIFDKVTPRADAEAIFEKIYGDGGVK